jgi:hypothetical protein
VRRSWILHPFLIALFPAASLLARNVGQLPASEAARAALVCLSLSAIVLLIARVALKDWYAAAVLASLSLLLFFSYGHAYNQIEGRQLAGLTVGRHRFLTALWAALWLGGVAWIWRSRATLRRWTGPLNLIAAALLCIPLATLLLAAAPGQPARPTPQPSAGLPQPGQEQEQPDIYFIVVDGYARQDILQSVHGFDNAPFIQALVSREFTLPEGSRSNYANTALSLATALNLDYLPAILPDLDPESRDLAPLQEIIVDSDARRLAEDLGYQIVAFASGYRPSEWTDADAYLQPDTQGAAARGIAAPLTPFEGMLFESTAARLLLEANALLPPSIRLGLDAPYQAHRARIDFALEGLGQIAARPEPTFTFAHLIIPHPPFVVGPDGQALTHSTAYTLGDTPFDGNREEYSRRYTDQVTYLNARLIETIDQIQSRSSSPPIILLLSDHGSGATPLPGPPTPVDYVEERFSNFTALSLPGCQVGALPEHLSPVNALRLVFSSCFGRDYPLLEDRSYLSSYIHPFELQDVTDQLGD